MTVTDLETKRRAAQRQIDQFQAPARAAEAAAQALADLEQQIEAARQQEVIEARERQQHQNAIAAARAEYEAMPPALVAALRSIHIGRLRLVDLGAADPGDRLLSVEAIAAPSFERDQRSAANIQASMERDRATPEQVEAARERQNLIDQLHIIGRPWDEAERLAAAVADGSMTLEQALDGASEEIRHEFSI